MRKKRVMLIGPSGCGKSCLANAINGSGHLTRKTQDVIYGEKTIDVPGAYLENRMYSHLIALAQGASRILLLADVSGGADCYPPGFAQVFPCPVTGVVTKTDLDPGDRHGPDPGLKRAGAPEPFFGVSVRTGEGIPELIDYLFGTQCAEGVEKCGS